MAFCTYPTATELKDMEKIPGFKAILKAVIKSQILSLVNQLANQTGEQTMILTADVDLRTFSQFGSSDSTDFLTGRDEVQTDFLKHCIHKSILRQHQPVFWEPREDDNDSSRLDTATKPTSSALPNVRRKQSYKLQQLLQCYNTEEVASSKSEPTGTRTSKRKSTAEKRMENALHETAIDKNVLSEGIRGPVNKKRRKNGEKSAKPDNTSEEAMYTVHVADEESVDDKIVISTGASSLHGDTAETGSDISGNSDPIVVISESQEDGQEQKYSEESDRDDGGDKAEEWEDNEEGKEEVDDSILGVDNNELGAAEESLAGSPGDKVIKVAKTGRRYVSGQALNEVLRSSIVLQIVEQGGDLKTGNVPRGVFTKVSKSLGVYSSSVSRIWERYVNDGTITPRYTS